MTMAYKIAFKVKHDSELYAQYFDAREEITKFRALAVPFFEKHGIDGRYYQSRRLAVKFSGEQRKKFAEHLTKYPDKWGFSRFKLKSPIEQEWEETVSSKVDFNRMEQADFWWLAFIMCGKYNLWDFEGEIYGYLEDSYQKDITPGDFMEQIKISEYYAAIERLEGND